MNSRNYYDKPVRNIVPVFLDFPADTVDNIAYATRDLPVFFVTCLDIYNMFIDRGIDNVRFMPLSVADKHYSLVVPEKIVDVIQFGRKNFVLHEYMLRYCEEHPSIEYVYQTADGSLTYNSTTRGNIGKCEKREEYINLVKSCKVSLVSTPGCDNSRSAEFGEIDFVTPRCYESAAFYCHMLGRYTDNQETRELELGRICPNIQSYEEFSKYLNDYLSAEEWDWTAQREFVSKNLTSVRAHFIQETMAKL